MAPSNSSAITQDDPRYKEMFSVENETLHAGHVLVDDPYPAFAALRAGGAVISGSIVEKVTGRPDPQFAGNDRPHFTTLTFDACSKALIDNETYSSALYQEQGGVMENIGHTVLSMVGSEHARHRAAVQPMMTRLPMSRGMVKQALRQFGLGRAIDSGAFDDHMLDWAHALLRHTDTFANDIRS